MAKSVKSVKYVDLISKSSQDVEKELIELSVEQAKNTLEQGTLSVKSQLLAAQGDVKKAEILVSNAERALNASKSANPINVQNILDARKAKLDAEESVITAKYNCSQIEDAYNYLVTLKTELF